MAELNQEEKDKLSSLKGRIAENVFSLGQIVVQEEEYKTTLELIKQDKKEIISLIDSLEKEIKGLVDEFNKKSDDHLFDISTGEFVKK